MSLRCVAAFLVITVLSPAQAAETQHCVAADIVLWGDARHDDTAALNAWFAGKDLVWADSGAPVGERIAGRSFRLSGAVYARAGSGRRLEDFRMVWPERGETVAGSAIATGSNPDAAPVATGISILGGAFGGRRGV